MVKQTKLGFTLIEVLAVIAIVAVLAAILFPVFSSAKRASKKSSAISNLSNIGKATLLYASDNGDRLPPEIPGMTEWPGLGISMGSTGLTKAWYRECYAPYLKSEEIWFSPEDRLRGRTIDGMKVQTSFTFNGQLTYAWNLSQITRPSETIYVADRSDLGHVLPSSTYHWWLFTKEGLTSFNQLPGTLDPIQVARDISAVRYVGNVGCYLFLDGHVKAMDFDKTWGDQSRNMHLAVKS